MKARVNKDACIGCGACQAIEPDVFDFNDDGYAYVKCENIEASKQDNVLEAAEGCPTAAIEVEQ